MSYTLEQQKAIALAKARRRKAESLQAVEPQQEPVEMPQQELTQQEAPAVEQPQTLEQQFLAIPGMAPLSELAASANKTVFEMIDFLGPNNVNAVLQLVGSDSRMPTLADNLGSDGGYMEEGVARDAVRGLGQALTVGAGMTPAVGRNLASAKGIAQEALGLGTAKVAEPIKTATKAATTAISDALPSKAKDAAKLPLYRNSGDIVTAGFKLDDAGKVVRDKVQKAAIKAGVDEGAVAMISSSNKPTKKRLSQMVDVLEKGRDNLEYRNFNPPQRVIGQALESRLDIIQRANKSAASRLDSVANKLKNKPVNIDNAMSVFIDDMQKQGIKVDINKGTLDFTDSIIEGDNLNGAQGIITNVFNRVRRAKDPSKNAHRVHMAKGYIDEQVSYGKSPEGLSGKMDSIVKRLRRNLDQTLDQNFPEYDEVNTMYSETRSMIDEVQSLAGSKVDLTGDKADKALGVMSRKVLSNYNTGTATEELFDQLDNVARRYSTPLDSSIDDELRKLVSAEAELRKMFPTASKPNTFQGEIGAEVMRGAANTATGNKLGLVGQAAKAAGKVFSKSDEAKIQAIKDLLAE